MARKSRKNIVLKTEEIKIEEIKTEIENKSNQFKTAIYVRLSVEKDSNDTIENQIAYCKDFVYNNVELNLIDIYVDNGVTGTVFDRPDFNRLIADIKDSKINCIVVKDLSRFGRDYIETGTYLERIFPSLGIRFISINENYDNTNSSSEALMIPLQNMINGLYAKDISRKISTTLRLNMESGTFKQSCIPYGYILNEDRKMVIDYEVSEYIQLIFSLKIDGVSSTEIANKLNNMNAPTPISRKKNVESKWSRGSVEHIFTNTVYIGDTILGKNRTSFYKGEKRHSIKNSDEWFIFENTHKGIISREDFQIVQDILQENSNNFHIKIEESKKDRESLINLFENKIFCGDCSKKMYFARKKMDYKGYETDKNLWYATYICSTYSKNTKLCKSHYIRQDYVNSQVLDIIKFQIRVGIDYDKLILKLKNSATEKSIREQQNSNIASLKIRKNSIQGRIRRLYDDLTDGVLDRQDYLFTKEMLYSELDTINVVLEKVIVKKQEFDNALSSENKWINLMKTVSGARELNKALVDAVIEKVIVYDSDKIEVVMRYSDIYEMTKVVVEELNSMRSAKTRSLFEKSKAKTFIMQ